MSRIANVVGPISEDSKLGVPRGRLQAACPEVVVIRTVKSLGASVP